MSRNTQVSLSVVAVVAAVIGLLLLVNRPDRPTGAAAPGQVGVSTADRAALLVRPDSHRLSTAPDGKVTVVEFLDLECEACGATHPNVERLRAEYGDRITVVMRHFPLPGHLNGELAATAVEAASRQGRLEEMYDVLFETQPYWGDQRGSHRETFLGFAREMGLDMARFEADLDDPATTERVRRDRADGIALGVTATPTFFVNGTQFRDVPTYEALKAAVERELAR